jgi:hypothetical protein
MEVLRFFPEGAATAKAKVLANLRNHQNFSVVGLHLFADGKYWGAV